MYPICRKTHLQIDNLHTTAYVSGVVRVVNLGQISSIDIRYMIHLAVDSLLLSCHCQPNDCCWIVKKLCCCCRLTLSSQQSVSPASRLLILVHSDRHPPGNKQSHKCQTEHTRAGNESQRRFHSAWRAHSLLKVHIDTFTIKNLLLLYAKRSRKHCAGRRLHRVFRRGELSSYLPRMSAK